MPSQFPHRISLSQAAEISGYHHDYLGQLCRLGKIRASKIGRNWYTTRTELQVLLSGDADNFEIEDDYEEPVAQAVVDSSSVEEAPVEVVQVAPVSIDAVRITRPVVADNALISEVAGIPIQLRTHNPVKAEHTVQTLITRMKLDALKTEVLQIAQYMDEVNEKLARHEEILEELQAQRFMRTDLRETFAPGLSAAPRVAVRPESLLTVVDEPVEVRAPAQQWAWAWAAVAIMMIVIPVALLAIIPKSQGPTAASTVYYQTQTTNLEAEVAGATDTLPQ